MKLTDICSPFWFFFDYWEEKGEKVKISSTCSCWPCHLTSKYIFKFFNTPLSSNLQLHRVLRPGTWAPQHTKSEQCNNRCYDAEQFNDRSKDVIWSFIDGGGAITSAGSGVKLNMSMSIDDEVKGKRLEDLEDTHCKHEVSLNMWRLENWGDHQ